MGTSTGKREFIEQFYPARRTKRSGDGFRTRIDAQSNALKLSRQALAQDDTPRLMIAGRCIPQRVRHALR
jgi:hypothetical protein